MDPTKTINFNIHFVNILLKSKNISSLAIIQSLMDELRKKKVLWDRQVSSLLDKQSKLKEKEKSAKENFNKLLSDLENKTKLVRDDLNKKIALTQESIGKLEKRLSLGVEGAVQEELQAQLRQLVDRLGKSHESLRGVEESHQVTFKDLEQKRQQISLQVQGDLGNISEEILATKDLVKKASDTVMKLDRLHHAVTKNPVTLFNDKISHDMLLLAAKDKEFKEVLNDFLIKFLELKDFTPLCEKIGAVMADIYQKEKSLSLKDMHYVYLNMIKTVMIEGVERLDKPIEMVLVAPEMERALQQFKSDISISEIIQIAKLDLSIQKKVLSIPVAVEYFIQLLRFNEKNKGGGQEPLVVTEAGWNALLFLVSRWPVFFMKFSQNLNSFSDPQMIYHFHQTIQEGVLMLENENSLKVFDKVLFLRERSKDTFSYGMKTSDYISLLRDTVLMTKTLRMRRVYYLEVLGIQDELQEDQQKVFLKVFHPEDVALMDAFSYTRHLSVDEQEDVFLRINSEYEKLESLLQLFHIQKYEDLPSVISNFFKTIYIDAGDHLHQMENIIEKVLLFEKNISLSVVSSDKQLPLANAVYQSVIKCGEYTHAYQALKEMVITKELHKMLTRKSNQQKG